MSNLVPVTVGLDIETDKHIDHLPDRSSLRNRNWPAKAEYSGALCQPMSAFESAAQIISDLGVSEYLLSPVSANRHLTFGSV